MRSSTRILAAALSMTIALGAGATAASAFGWSETDWAAEKAADDAYWIKREKEKEAAYIQDQKDWAEIWSHRDKAWWAWKLGADKRW